MELRQIYTFRTIIKEGSFQQAADKLQYAQSTITLHIQQLEAELGVKLFTRRGKKIQLTEAGRSLQKEADSLVQRAMALQQTMIDLVSGEAGHLRIGAIEPTASMRLPSIFVPFCLERPKVHLTLEVGGTHVLSQRVAAGALDLGICSPPDASLGLTFEMLFMEKMALLLPSQHPLASLEVIHAKDLIDQRLLLTEKGCTYRDYIETLLLQHGTNPYSGIEIGSLEALKHAVQKGLGIAIIPVTAVDPLPSQTILREIHAIDLKLPVGLIYSLSENFPSRALNALLSLLRTHFQEDKAMV